jgi:hypothetical protein
MNNGVSGVNSVRTVRGVKYRYQNAASDVHGRGSLGFREVTATDEQTQISTTGTFLHETKGVRVISFENRILRKTIYPDP